jgi:chromosome segregation ATPase
VSIWSALLGYVVGPTLVAIVAYASARTAAKGSKQAADRSADVEENSVQITGFHQLVQDLQSARDADRKDIDRLRKDVDEHEQWRGTAEKQIATLKHQAKRDKDLIRRLVARLRAAIVEIQRLGGTVPPDSDQDLDRISLILDGETS